MLGDLSRGSHAEAELRLNTLLTALPATQEGSGCRLTRLAPQAEALFFHSEYIRSCIGESTGEGSNWCVAASATDL